MAPQINSTDAPRPPNRRLRAFAFDPIRSRRIETHEINEVTIKLPWEDQLELGPVDDYLAVVDYDPASQVFYAPVNLNDGHLLAQDGLPPSEANPQFHQQMVYAVARTTIRHFEWALGRRALWSSRQIEDKNNPKDDEDYVDRLRIYPHALREANAYYTPAKKALLFGYFPASMTAPGGNLPGGTVFTCLSHDIVAHETTHALLDGLHPRFIEPSNGDVWALHEAFADIVALFQHFTYPEALRHQLARARGDLQIRGIMTDLAYQFGQAIERYGALRSAIKKLDPEEIQHTTESHQRGAILVAAVFDAFLTIYNFRIRDLLRIATGGTGVLAPGELHPDLVERLAQEAAKTARHILHICIRALDYCPPVDVDFGDYLRALITADHDLVTYDRLNYRLAIIEAFRRRGIYPRDVRNLSEESLLWHKPNKAERKAFDSVFGNPERLRELIPDWGMTTNRKEIFNQARESRKRLQKWLVEPDSQPAVKAAGIVLEKNAPEAFYRDQKGIPTLEIHSVRPARRIGPNDQTVTELVVEMTQRRRGYYDPTIQTEADRGHKNVPDPDFIFRGGCTLLINPDGGEVRYCIYKDIRSTNRLKRMRSFLTGEEDVSLAANYFGDPRKMYFRGLTAKPGSLEKAMQAEPFALLHRSFEGKEVM